VREVAFLILGNRQFPRALTAAADVSVVIF